MVDWLIVVVVAVLIMGMAARLYWDLLSRYAPPDEPATRDARLFARKVAREREQRIKRERERRRQGRWE